MSYQPVWYSDEQEPPCCDVSVVVSMFTLEPVCRLQSRSGAAG